MCNQGFGGWGACASYPALHYMHPGRSLVLDSSCCMIWKAVHQVAIKDMPQSCPYSRLLQPAGGAGAAGAAQLADNELVQSRWWREAGGSGGRCSSCWAGAGVRKQKHHIQLAS